MARSKPCAVCSKWFHPNPRLGNRQHTCGDPKCRSEWHKRSCRKWRKGHRDYDRATRLEGRLVKGPPSETDLRLNDPLTVIDWGVARERAGLETAVLVEETGKVLLHALRDAMPLQIAGNNCLIRKSTPVAARDAIPSQLFENKHVPRKSSPHHRETR